jgi:hypothetical protein
LVAGVAEWQISSHQADGSIGLFTITVLSGNARDPDDA